MQHTPDVPQDSGFTLRFERSPGFLLAEVEGERSSAAITLAYWREIAHECERVGARRLLVIDHFRGNAVSVDEMRACVHALGNTILATLRIALYEPEAENVAALQHAELDALEAGFEFRVFGSRREAEIWLRYGGG